LLLFQASQNRGKLKEKQEKAGFPRKIPAANQKLPEIKVDSKNY
jgi:hypothetical protein